jgi:hypothetical protein
MTVGTSGRPELVPYKDKPDDRMLKFRTITSIIGIIHKFLRVGYTHIQPPAKPSPSDPHRERQLRILLALATLLVRKHEIVAVAVAHPGPLALVACASESALEPTQMGDELEATTSDLDGRADFSITRTPYCLPHGGHFVTVRNPRNNDSSTTVRMVEPKPMEINVGDPIAYLLQNW